MGEFRAQGLTVLPLGSTEPNNLTEEAFWAPLLPKVRIKSPQGLRVRVVVFEGLGSWGVGGVMA